MDEKEVKCPNCGTPTHAKPGEPIVCATCGGTFTFTAGETKLADVGEFDQLKKKVGDLELGQAELRERLGEDAERHAGNHGERQAEREHRNQGDPEEYLEDEDEDL
jgi:hypothetical protein